MPNNLLLLPLLAAPILLLLLRQARQRRLTVYVHDYLTGPDASAVTIAGNEGSNSSVLRFGTLVAVDDPVTEGPVARSREIGRAQGLYVNSQADGRALHLLFSIIFTGGEYAGSTLEIQGADLFGAAEREFSVVAGTGRFRLVKGFGIMTTEMMDIPNLRAVLKLDITLIHY